MTTDFYHPVRDDFSVLSVVKRKLTQRHRGHRGLHKGRG
jgi:hypothetical protein